VPVADPDVWFGAGVAGELPLGAAALDVVGFAPADAALDAALPPPDDAGAEALCANTPLGASSSCAVAINIASLEQRAAEGRSQVRGTIQE